MRWARVALRAVLLLLTGLARGHTSGPTADAALPTHAALPTASNRTTPSHLCAAQRRQSHQLTASGLFDSSQVGFYLQAAHEEPLYLAEMLAGVRHFYPRSPIVFYSDAGNPEHEALCQVYNCTFVMAAESINADYKRTPRFSCGALMHRILRAIALNHVPFTYYWEPDTRALAPLARAPPQGMMQQLNHLFPFKDALRRVPDLEATLHALHPGQLCGRIQGYSTTGGTLFHGQELARAVEAQGGLAEFYGSAAWQALNGAWHDVPNRTSDVCLLASALVAKLTVGQWPEYNELRHMSDVSAPNGAPILPRGAKERCLSCIAACQQQHAGAAPWTVPARAPPAVDACVFETCGATHACPPILHKVKHTWRDLPVGKTK